MREVQRSALAFAMALAILACARHADADLARVWRQPPRGTFLGIGHITSATRAQALYGENDPSHNCCCGIWGYSILRVMDLQSGQIVASWAMECPDDTGIGAAFDKWLVDVDGDGLDEIMCLITRQDQSYQIAMLRFDGVTGVLSPNGGFGDRLGLGIIKASPNPALRSTRISFSLSEPSTADLEIFDVAGRRVRTYRVTAAEPGEQAVRWDGRDDGGRTVPSGAYLYSVKVGTQGSTKKCVLLN